MANVRAFRNGNWSDTNPATSPWGTGGVLYAPATTDVIYSNSFTVQVDTTTATSLTVTNAASASILFKDGATTTATAGGSFNLNTSGVTLNAAVNAGTANCVTCSLNSPSTVTINGNVTGSPTNSSTSAVNYSGGTGSLTIIGNIVGGSAAAGSAMNGVSFNSTGTLNVTGTVTGGSGSNSNNFGITCGSAATINITGAVTGGLGTASNEGFRFSGNGTATINGNITSFTGGTGGWGVNLYSGTGSITITGTVSGTNTNNMYGVSLSSGSSLASITINGNVTGGSAGTSAAVYNAGPGTLTINGNATGGVGSNSYGAYNNSTGNIIINGSVTGGSSTSGYGALNSGIGTITINGTASASDTAHGAYNNSTGSIAVTRAKANGYGVGTVGKNASYGLFNSTQSVCTVKEIEYGPLGMSPTAGIVLINDVSSNVAVFYKANGSPKTLTDPNANSVFPAASDVRFGTSYNSGNLTGTLAVPAASSVAAGVPVDNTVGTAVLTQANVWNYALSSASSVAGSVGEKLKKTAIPADVIALG